MPIGLLKARFREAEATLEQLILSGILKQDCDGNIFINFLIDQRKEISERHEILSVAGRKGGLRQAKGRLKHKDKDKDIKERIKENTWRTNFDIYQDMCRGAYRELLNNENWIMDQEKYHPKFNIPLTVEACFKNFWATKAGWKNKKGNKTDDPDWPATIARTMDKNPVYK